MDAPQIAATATDDRSLCERTIAVRAEAHSGSATRSSACRVRMLAPSMAEARSPSSRLAAFEFELELELRQSTRRRRPSISGGVFRRRTLALLVGKLRSRELTRLNCSDPPERRH
ncbi:MAG: hypothetical protein K0S37_3875 [Microbacterium sp.]|nr:hypothetical protein [Microbacterium sp.]